MTPVRRSIRLKERNRASSAASPSASSSSASLWEEGDDHDSNERISNEHEELKDAAADHDHEFDTFTIKTGMRGFLRLEGDERMRFMNAIEETVAEMTLLSWDLMKLCNFYLLRCFEAHRPVAPNFGSQSFFYFLATKLSTSKRRKEQRLCSDDVLEETCQSYLEMRSSSGTRLAHRDYMTPNLSYIAKDMIVACKNHISTNLYRRLRRWVSLQLGDREGDEHHEEVKQVMDDIGTGFRGRRSRRVSRVVRIVRDLLAAANMPPSENLLYQSEISKHWVSWLPVLYQIGVDFAAGHEPRRVSGPSASCRTATFMRGTLQSIAYRPCTNCVEWRRSRTYQEA